MRPFPNPGFRRASPVEGGVMPSGQEWGTKGIALAEGGSTATRWERVSKGIALSRAGIG